MNLGHIKMELENFLNERIGAAQYKYIERNKEYVSGHVLMYYLIKEKMNNAIIYLKKTLGSLGLVRSVNFIFEAMEESLVKIL